MFPSGQSRLTEFVIERDLMLANSLLRLLPGSALIARLCRRYAIWSDGENNADLNTNGELRFIKRNLEACRTVLDVGANAGNWSAAALKINPDLDIHCFEPNDAAFDELVEMRFPPSVTLNRLALGAQPGSAALYMSAGHSSFSSFYRRQSLGKTQLEGQWSTEDVDISTVDDYCAEKGIQGIDLAKIDVEGHELQVMRGMSRMLSEGRVKLIQFEYGGTYIDSHVLLKDVFEFLSSHGLKFWKILPHKLLPVGEYATKFENFNYQNWVASAPSFRLRI